MTSNGSSAPTSMPVPTSTPVPPPPTPVGHKGNWELIFNDEFNGTALDTNKWTTCFWWDWQGIGCTISSNNELEWYQPDDVLVSDGLLRLRAQSRTIAAGDGRTYQFTSGMISSGRSREDPAPPGLVFQYGYAEIRAKLPAGQGLWPAFWMLPEDNQNDRSKPEIDIMEVLGHAPDTIHMTLHYQVAGTDKSDNEGIEWVGPDFSDDWHTFAIDWQPEALVWYVDGIERWRFIDAAYIPSEPMYLLLNLAVGGDWPGSPDDSTIFPSYYEIDYVRVWKHR